jgi:hypothetical protein
MLAPAAPALSAAHYTISFSVDTDASTLTSYEDQHLAMLWHISQGNPADYGDAGAGEFAEKIGREIIRRWVSGVPPVLWNHQGRDFSRRQIHDALCDAQAAVVTAAQSA